MYVVLVPPTEQTGVYSIERVQEPDKLGKDEFGIRIFKVICLSGKIGVDNLKMDDFSNLGVLSVETNVFTFRAFSFTTTQSDPSEKRSVPVISVLEKSFPQQITDTAKNELINKVTSDLYSLLDITSYTVTVFDTLNKAWEMGMETDEILKEAREDSEKAFSKKQLEELYAKQVSSPTAPAQATPTPTPPGFEVVFAIAGLLVVAYLKRRE